MGSNLKPGFVVASLLAALGAFAWDFYTSAAGLTALPYVLLAGLGLGTHGARQAAKFGAATAGLVVVGFLVTPGAGTLWVAITDRALILILVLAVTALVMYAHHGRTEMDKMASAVEQCPSGIMLTDLDGTIRYVNRRFRETSEFAATDIIGRKPNVLKSGNTEPATYSHLWNTIKSGVEWRGTIQNRKKNGKLYWNEESIVPVRDRNGTVTQYLAVTHDVTTQIESEKAMRQATEAAELSNRAKSEFLANMSHELRTPLNAIIGFSQALEGGIGGQLSAKQSEYVRDIQGSGVHLLNLISDILDVSRVELGELEIEEEEIDLAQIGRAASHLVNHRLAGAGLSLETNFTDQRLVVLGDGQRIKQVVLNLLSNAIKFTDQGGLISLTAGVAEDGSAYLNVTDTGIGMTGNEIETSLMPFGQVESGMTRNYDGSGLGLPLSKSVMEAHGGTLRIESVPSRGTSVTASFPHERMIATAARVESAQPVHPAA